ncbi:MAG: hypothetical protein QOH70_3603 [Blastocatellia bacterium]|nr:hypothetical protein [Blastocatellia bacterium]
MTEHLQQEEKEALGGFEQAGEPDRLYARDNDEKDSESDPGGGSESDPGGGPESDRGGGSGSERGNSASLEEKSWEDPEKGWSR